LVASVSSNSKPYAQCTLRYSGIKEFKFVAFSCGSRDNYFARDFVTSRRPPLVGVEVYPYERSPFTFVGGHCPASVGDKVGGKLSGTLEEGSDKAGFLGRGSSKEIKVVSKYWAVVLGRWLVGKGLSWVVYGSGSM